LNISWYKNTSRLWTEL